jgi:hypothetical protein
MAVSGEICIKYIYTVQIIVSTIRLDAKYINRKIRLAGNELTCSRPCTPVLPQGYGNIMGNSRNSWLVAHNMIIDV